MADKTDEADEPPRVTGAPVPPGAFVFPPRTVALVSVLLAVACLGTLVIVATRKNVDALSTIALALAILAFVAQLIIYIVQAATSSQQLFLAQQVQRETATILSGIQASADATQAVLAQQYDRVIERLITTTAEAEAPGDEDDDGVDNEGREVLLNRLRDIVREEVARSQPTLAPNPMYKISPSLYGDTSLFGDASLYSAASDVLRQTRPRYGSGYSILREDPSKLREDPSTLKEDPSKLKDESD